MEVKVYYDTSGGAVAVESHTIPEFAGEVRNKANRESGTDVTVSETDAVESIVERLTIGEEAGIWLSRTVTHERADAAKPAPDAWRDVTRTVCVVPSSRMGDVLRVVCDGETVWPEENVEDKLDALEDAVRALS